EDREVEVEVTQSMPIENMMIPMGGGMEGGMDSNMMDMLQDMLPKRTKRRNVTVSEARRILLQDELDKLVNMDEVVNEALDRVELKSLTEADFVRILTEPKNALITQYRALVAAEGAALDFTQDGVNEIARTAAQVNERMENIGARRLHTVLTTLLEDILFDL